MRRIAALSVGALLLAGFVGCERAEDPATRRGNVQRNQGPSTTVPAPAPPDTLDRPTTTAPNAMHTQMLNTWKTQVNDLETRVDGLQAKIDSYQGAMKDQIQQQYTDLKQKVSQLQDRVQNFNVSDTAGFDPFRNEVETHLTQINQELRDIDQKLSQPAAPSDTPAETPEMPETPPETPRNP